MITGISSTWAIYIIVVERPFKLQVHEIWICTNFAIIDGRFSGVIRP